MPIKVMQGVLIPFAGTFLGAACVLFMKDTLRSTVRRILTGFAAGVMAAASIWSLLIPSMEQSESMGKWSFVPAVLGFWFGILFLLFFDKVIPHLHQGSNEPEGPNVKLKKTTMLVLAVTLHNIPEGIAVGVVFAGLLSDTSTITVAGALALSIGIAIQNFPEGAIISMPLRSEGMKSSRAFFVRSIVRRRRTDSRGGYNFCGGVDCSGAGISFELCGGSDDLCCSRGTYSGDVGRKTF